MIRVMTVAVCVVLASISLDAANKEEDRLADAGVVIEEVLAIDDNIPQDLLDKAECVIVIPSMLKVALGIGGSYGRGAMVCRTGRASTVRGGRPRCMHSTAEVSASSLAGRRRIWCCW
jgi:SH3 domain-containing YSC84-like protein 1